MLADGKIMFDHEFFRLQAWGTVRNNDKIYGIWTDEEKTEHIK